MKLPSFSQLKNTKNASIIILWSLLMVVLVLDVLTLKRSYTILSQAKTNDLGITTSKSVRIDFDAYNKVIDRIQKSESYTPDPVTVSNPFLSPPKKSN